MSYELPKSQRILLPTTRPPRNAPQGFQPPDENYEHILYYDVIGKVSDQKPTSPITLPVPKLPQKSSSFTNCCSTYSKLLSVLYSCLFLTVGFFLFLLILHWTGYLEKKELEVHTERPTTSVTHIPSTVTSFSTISSDPSSTIPSGTCVSGYTKFDKTGFCYKKIYHKTDFNGAQRACESEDANLASIHSEEENEFLANLSRRDNAIYDNHNVLGLDQEIWIGLHYVSGKWEWIDGTPVDYEKWAVGEPNRMDHEVQVTMVTSKLQGYSPNGSHWNNVREFSRQKGLICKKPSNSE